MTTESRNHEANSSMSQQPQSINRYESGGGGLPYYPPTKIETPDARRSYYSTTSSSSSSSPQRQRRVGQTPQQQQHQQQQQPPPYHQGYNQRAKTVQAIPPPRQEQQRQSLSSFAQAGCGIAGTGSLIASRLFRSQLNQPSNWYGPPQHHAFEQQPPYYYEGQGPEHNIPVHPGTYPPTPMSAAVPLHTEPPDTSDSFVVYSDPLENGSVYTGLSEQELLRQKMKKDIRRKEKNKYGRKKDRRRKDNKTRIVNFPAGLSQSSSNNSKSSSNNGNNNISMMAEDSPPVGPAQYRKRFNEQLTVEKQEESIMSQPMYPVRPKGAVKQFREAAPVGPVNFDPSQQFRNTTTSLTIGSRTTSETSSTASSDDESQMSFPLLSLQTSMADTTYDDDDDDNEYFSSAQQQKQSQNRISHSKDPPATSQDPPTEDSRMESFTAAVSPTDTNGNIAAAEQVTHANSKESPLAVPPTRNTLNEAPNQAVTTQNSAPKQTNLTTIEQGESPLGKQQRHLDLIVQEDCPDPEPVLESSCDESSVIPSPRDIRRHAQLMQRRGLSSSSLPPGGLKPVVEGKLDRKLHNQEPEPVLESSCDGSSTVYSATKDARMKVQLARRVSEQVRKARSIINRKKKIRTLASSSSLVKSPPKARLQQPKSKQTAEEDKSLVKPLLEDEQSQLSASEGSHQRRLYTENSSTEDQNSRRSSSEGSHQRQLYNSVGSSKLNPNREIPSLAKPLIADNEKELSASEERRLRHLYVEDVGEMNSIRKNQRNVSINGTSILSPPADKESPGGVSEGNLSVDAGITAIDLGSPTSVFDIQKSQPNTHENRGAIFHHAFNGSSDQWTYFKNYPTSVRRLEEPNDTLNDSRDSTEHAKPKSILRKKSNYSKQIAGNLPDDKIVPDSRDLKVKRVIFGNAKEGVRTDKKNLGFAALPPKDILGDKDDDDVDKDGSTVSPVDEAPRRTSVPLPPSKASKAKPPLHEWLEKENDDKQKSNELDSTFDSYTTSSSTFIETVAAIVIQTCIRRYLAICKAERMYFERRHAKTNLERSVKTRPVLAEEALVKKRQNADVTKLEDFENLAARMYDLAAVQIQCLFRGWWVRDTLVVDHYCATRIQSGIRRYLCRKNYKNMKYDLPHIIKVQSLWRRRQSINESATLLCHVIHIQAVYRGYRDRKRLFDWQPNSEDLDEYELENIAATLIQAQWRCHDTQLIYLQYLSDIILIQSCIRGWIVRGKVIPYLMAEKRSRQRAQSKEKAHFKKIVYQKRVEPKMKKVPPPPEEKEKVDKAQPAPLQGRANSLINVWKAREEQHRPKLATGIKL